MSLSNSASTLESAKDTSSSTAPRMSVRKPTPEGETDRASTFGKRVVAAVGGNSPQTPPMHFSSLLGHTGGSPRTQAAILRQLQQRYGNSYVGRVIQYQRRQQSDRADTTVSGDFPRSLEPGQPLDDATRRFMESRFGYSFSQVRTHTNAQAARATSALNAQAFTVGRDIYFGQSQYQPDTTEGRRLLAHELTHTIQQANGGISLNRELTVGHADDPYEREADAVADEIVKAKSATAIPVAPKRKVGQMSSQARIQRAIVPLPKVENIIGFIVGNEVVELKGKSRFEPSWMLATYIKLAGNRGAPVRVRFGGLASGMLWVYWRNDGYYATPQPLPMTHPEITVYEPKQHLVLEVGIVNGVISGQMNVLAEERQYAYPVMRPAYGVKLTEPPPALLRAIFGRTYARTTPQIVGFTDALENGQLSLSFGFILETVDNQRLIGAFALIDEAAGWKASLNAQVKGLKPISMDVERDPNGILSARKATIGTEWEGKGFKGTLTATFVNGLLDIRGTARYSSPRLSGEVTLLATDEEKARAAARAHLPFDLPPSQEPETEPANYTTSPKMALTGWGSAEVIITKPLPKQVGPIKGTVAFVVDPDGYITTRGTVRALKRYQLLEQKGWGWHKELNYNQRYPLLMFKGFFLEVAPDLTFSVDAFLGPITLYDLMVEGIFSTGPYPTELSLSGRLNISAAVEPKVVVSGSLFVSFVKLVDIAEVRLGIEGAMPLTVYLDAKPTIKRHQSASAGTDKREPPDYSIDTLIHAAGRADLKLKGVIDFKALHQDLYTINLADRTYRVADLGIKGEIHHTFGSGEKPQLKFEKDTFRPSLFLTDLLKRRPARMKHESDKDPRVEGSLQQDDRQIGAKVSSEANLPPQAPADISPTELKESFSMEGQSHTLFLKLGAPGAAASIEMATTDRKPLAEKIQRAVGRLQARRDVWFTAETDEERVNRRIKELNAIQSAAEKVETAASKLGLDPKGVIYTNVPGFVKLAEQLQLYGDRYGVKDIVGEFGQLSRLITIPDIKPGDYVKWEDKTLLVTQVHVKTNHGEAVRVRTGRADVRKTNFLLFYENYGRIWEKIVRDKPIYESFTAFGVGQGGQVVIDRENLAQTETSPSASDEDKKDMGFGGKHIYLGHLVAHKFRGPDTYKSGNIVAMTKEANFTNKGMRGIERPVQKDIEENFAVYQYMVRPKDPAKPPTTIEVVANRLFPSTSPAPEVPSSKEVDNS
jgi:hypothetical protein